LKYKAISLKQPWASLVAEGKKTIETRKWNTKYRGDLLICASQSPKLPNLPTGVVLCLVELYHTEPMAVNHEEMACIKVYPKAWSWFLRNIRVMEPTFPVKGKLSFYEVDVPAKIKSKVKQTKDNSSLINHTTLIL
jgi:hypothetical protein